jgi:hypothetical protein
MLAPLQENKYRRRSNHHDQDANNVMGGHKGNLNAEGKCHKTHFREAAWRE